MSQDSHPGYNPDPEKPYDITSIYEMPTQPPYAVPPSQYPYQVPPQSPYVVQQQFPYGMPPQGTYGAPGYDPHQGSYGYQASSPLPLSVAIRQLPNQYGKILSKPSSATFVAEMGKASWDILWIQLIGYAVIANILRYLPTLISEALNTYKTSTNIFSLPMARFQAITLDTSLWSIITIFIFFFAGQGITYLLAKAFGGTGTFLRQGYTYLLILVPIGIISSLLHFIPIVGDQIAFYVGIGGTLGWQIHSIMAVHHLSQRKAADVVLISLAVIVVLVIIAIVAVL